VCPQSPFGVLKNCGAQTNYSETVEVFFFFLTWTDGIGGHLYVSQSVVCEMATFFQEQTINVNTYLDMTQLHAVPQIEHLQPHIILQQDGAPPHWGLQVSACLDRNMDRQRRSNVLASTFTRHNTTGFFPGGLCQEQCVPSTS
jgi:hypothetical protein